MFFSIIIPTHQRPLFLQESIVSVQRQSMQDWEIIVVEDAAELTLPAMQGITLLARGARPKGANACRNIGMAQAKGEYLIFLDDDDVLAPNALQRLFAQLSIVPADLCIGQAAWFAEWEGTFGTDGPKTLEAMVKGRCKWAISAVAWRKEFLEEKKLHFRERLQNAQEWVFHVEALLARPKIAELPHLISEIRAHRHNRSWQVDRNYLWQQVRARQIAGGKLLLRGHLRLSIYTCLIMFKYLGAYLKHVWRGFLAKG